MKILLTLLIFLCYPPAAFADNSMSESDLQRKAEAFIDAKNERQQPDTTIEDIDYFISFLSDDFKDEHIKFNVTVTDKAELRRGMVEKMKDEIFFSEIKIVQVMVGRNVVFVKYTEHAKVKPSHLDKVIQYNSTNIMSLEFNDEGFIKHIRRHHG